MVGTSSKNELLDALIREHRKVVSEWSGNFGGHVGVREGWVEFDADTPVEDCETCDLIRIYMADRGSPR